MSTLFSFLLLAGSSALYAFWQQRSLKQNLTSKNSPSGWTRQLILTGVMITIVLVVNGQSYLKMKEIDALYQIDYAQVDSNGAVIEPSSSELLIGQLEVIGGTLSLVALVWRSIKTKASRITTLDQKSFVQVLSTVIQNLLVPFWLATFGLGSIFGVSAGFGLKEVVQHVELLVGPPLIMALELTVTWGILKYVTLRR